MSTDVAVRDERSPAQILVAQVRSEQFLEQVSLALPGANGAERFVRAAVTLLQEKPEIADAERSSVVRSIIRCAQDGLLPDGREAAIVVYRTNGVQKAQYLRMIAGVRKLAAEFGWTLRTSVVFEADEFEWEKGLEPRLTHRPARPGVERGRMVAAYAIASKPGRASEFEVMYEPDILKARSSSRSANKGPWVDWPERMWEKTVGHALFKQLPLGDLDVERRRRLFDEDEFDAGDQTAMLYGTPVIDARVVGEIGPGDEIEDTPLPGADDGPVETGAVGQQAVDAIESSDGVFVADGIAAPDLPEDEEPDLGPGDGVGGFVVPTGKCAGRTLVEIAAMDGGLGWLTWVEMNPGRVQPEVAANVQAFMRARS